MAISKGTTKGPSVRMGKAMGAARGVSAVGPSAGKRGKKMPHHGATGKRVVTSRKSVGEY
jgi:hypothetical protein